MKPLTSTSYAVLGLLAVKPSTAYELAKMVTRSLNHVWPRAEGRIYDEPKLLVQHGMAKRKDEMTGQRPRTVYSITAKGRRALADWVAAPGAGPQLEYEALLKVVFAEHGTKDDLVRSIDTIREHAELNLAFGSALAEEYLKTGGPYPERTAINGLMWNFLFLVHRAMAEWAAWASDEVRGWPDDLAVTPAMTERTMEVLRAGLELQGRAAT